MLADESTPVAEETPAAAEAEPAEAATETPDEPQQSTFEQRLEQILEEPEGDNQKDAETDEAAAGEPAAEGDEAPEAEAGTEPEEDADEGGEESGEAAADLVLRLPGRKPDDEDFELPLTREQLEAAGVDPDQVVERFNQLKNGYARRQEIEQERIEVQADRDELAFIEQQLRSSPTDFLVDRIDPSLSAEVARKLLVRLSDDDFDAVLGSVSEWDRDPSTRRLAAAKDKEESVTRRDESRTTQEKQRSQKEYITGLAKAITGLIPEAMDNAQADEFFDFAAHKLDAWARRQPPGRARITPDQVPALLEELGALTPYGLAGSGQQPSEQPRKTTSEDARRAQRPGDPELAERARQTGKDLKARRDRRANAAAVTPAGAGAGTADLAPPRGQTVEERLNWISKQK